MQAERSGGLISLIQFGDNYRTKQITLFEQMNIPRLSPWGYDGQMYAQLAIDPSLRDPAIFSGIDLPSYRARRIGMPVVAALMGHGDPYKILTSFALINFIAWGCLAFVLLKSRPIRTMVDVMQWLAILTTSGLLVSISRSLTDFPALVIGLSVLLITTQVKIQALLLSLATLFKETTILSFGAVLFPRAKIGRHWLVHKIGLLIILFGPLVCWSWYLALHVPVSEVATAPVFSGNFDWPLMALWNKYQTMLQWDFWANAIASWSPLPAEYRIGFLILFGFELLAPISLMIQAVYFFWRWDWTNPIWGFGIGFAILFFVIGDSVWVEQYAYCRVLLPMTVAFNLLLWEEPQKRLYWAVYVAGNLGLTGMALLLVYHALFWL